jgi:sorbitol/mannitol transport system substrate-binding protein
MSNYPLSDDLLIRCLGRNTMNKTLRALLGATALLTLAGAAAAETTITVATVNNGDMIRMQGLMDDFYAKNPDIKVDWVTLEENVLRQKVTTDIATKGGQFDVLTIGTYEVPIWGKQGWLVGLNDLPAEWDKADLLPAIAGGLTVDGELYAAPFYGESSMVMYRKDLMEAAGMTMPDAPTWADIKAAAAAMTDKSKEQYGICLRGKAGWGENMAFLTAMSNSYGAKWFDESWNPQFDGAAWKATLTDYLELMNNYGPPGASNNGFNENLSLMQTGHCGMWIDATVAASFVTGKDSQVADKMGFALAPDNGLGKRSNWLWAWSLAIPAGTEKVDAAKTFVAWATSKEYTQLVASKEGWANVPPGTRTSLYENPEYQKVPFAKMTLDSINSADPTNPTVDPVPYVGVQFVAIPEFQGMATATGQQFSAALAGTTSLDDALAASQELAKTEMTKAGYIK